MATNENITDTQLVNIVEEFGGLNETGVSSGMDPFENDSLEWDDSVVLREVTTSSPKKEDTIIISDDDGESPQDYQKKILLNRRDDLQRREKNMNTNREK
ncbi:hypothetical protein KP79_PYT22128 [Mizuhopecten yessoensis]|uniref:Uncharacterized protein n=1 Tax=Mizuhopecten yessoensis TaxID=6573 RepID=A0A210R4W5_MIZYE|nr:hypothetical protein KP79_PYT22128 [Mizuhopecten yessoensis]